MSLRDVALGVALCEADMDVKETRGNNAGDRIMEHLANADPPIHTAAPWCAAAVQGWTDIAADGAGVSNPLDAVRQEALVQSYHEWAEEGAEIVGAADAERGDLVLYQFGQNPTRWNHIGLVVVPPNASGAFRAVEGNTPLEDAPDDEQRDSRDKVDGVAVKDRTTTRYPVEFVRWAE
jgi:hypothetical protein